MLRLDIGEFAVIAVPSGADLRWVPHAAAEGTEVQVQAPPGEPGEWMALPAVAHRAGRHKLRRLVVGQAVIVRLRHIGAGGAPGRVAQSSTTPLARHYVQIGTDERAATAHAPPGTSRWFREAWTWPLAAGPIEVDMTRARDLQRDRIRVERAARWGAADRDFNVAQEAGTSTAAAATVRRKMRDAPAHASIDEAATPEALKLVTLDSILGA